jgi:caffeoyl-CoA O-methyltransferase
MSSKTIAMTDELRGYLLSVSLREPEILARLRAETAALPMAGMQISPEQGQFMALLVQALGVKKALEVGVFTGYSSLVVALALPPEGRIVACDVSEEWTGIARRYWREAGVAEKIELRLAPGAESLRALLAEGQAGAFDFAFIDADKRGYDTYYELALQLLRPGGVIGLDNVLRGGRVLNPPAGDEDTLAIRRLNEKLHRDERVSLSLLPIGDGLTLALKRG